MSIRAVGREVVWTFTPSDARDMARFIRENVSSRDLAIKESEALEQAAAEIVPPRAAQPLLSQPARSVITDASEALDEAIEAERERRRTLKAKRRPYHYWRERGDTEGPREEHWCDRCVGFYGVPHDKFTHAPNRLCRSLGHAPDCRQCACLECVVYEAWSAARA